MIDHHVTYEAENRALEVRNNQLSSEVRVLRAMVKDARAIAEEQATETSLWTTAETEREERLAKELGRLHMVLGIGCEA